MNRFAYLITIVLLTGCYPAAPPSSSLGEHSRAAIRFTEVAKASGVNFTHANGAYGRKFMPETVGSGVAFFDSDNDGDQDLLIVNGSPWPDKAARSPRVTSHFYQNDGKGHFTDVTAGSGFDFAMYGMGATVGDYDNDGDTDVFLTAVGANHLMRNDGNGHFTDVTAQTGVVGVPARGVPLKWKWSSGACFFDYDNDGKLDLFVCQYVTWSPERDPYCGHGGIRGYCPPDNFVGTHCTLYKNTGNGFRDVSRETGILNAPLGKSFSVGMADFNRDGWIDFAVTNDTWANFLFLNEGGKRFREAGVESGIAFAQSGKAKAGMGIDVADWRNNGRFGMVIGNFSNEGLSLFEAEDTNMPLFSDHSQKSGIMVPSLLNVTFATLFFDADLDGWQDILATNGHVDDIVNSYMANVAFRQTPLLFQNNKGQFADVTNAAGLADKIVGRGAAFADVDGDGDLDFALVDNGGEFRLYRNDTPQKNHYLSLHLEGTRSNRDGIGALVRVRAGGITQQQYVRSGGSFLSESQRNLIFGLGASDKVEGVEIRWPKGTIENVIVAADTPQHIVEGRGVVPQRKETNQ